MIRGEWNARNLEPYIVSRPRQSAGTNGLIAREKCVGL
jgi:hypothetical protein